MATPRPPKDAVPLVAAAPEPPEFDLAPGIRTLNERIRRDAERLGIDPDPSAEALHRFHRRLRKLRVALRVVDDLLPASRRPVAEEIRRRVTRLARLVGEVRDLDVCLAHLPRPAAPPRSGRPGAGDDALRRRLREEARTGRSLLGAFLRAEIDRGLFGDAATLVEAGAGRLKGARARRRLGRAAARAARRSEAARRRAGRRATIERMHEFRIALRRLHETLDLNEAAGGPGPGFPDRLALLQRGLGGLHDLDRRLEILEELGPELAGEVLVAATEERRRRLREELEGEVARKWVRNALAAFDP